MKVTMSNDGVTFIHLQDSNNTVIVKRGVLSKEELERIVASYYRRILPEVKVQKTIKKYVKVDKAAIRRKSEQQVIG